MPGPLPTGVFTARYHLPSTGTLQVYTSMVRCTVYYLPVPVLFDQLFRTAQYFDPTTMKGVRARWSAAIHTHGNIRYKYP